jgi:hypothetical protein
MRCERQTCLRIAHIRSGNRRKAAFELKPTRLHSAILFDNMTSIFRSVTQPLCVNQDEREQNTRKFATNSLLSPQGRLRMMESIKTERELAYQHTNIKPFYINMQRMKPNSKTPDAPGMYVERACSFFQLPQAVSFLEAQTGFQ